MNEAIPHAVLSDQITGQIKGRRLVAAVFLTFEFDPGFFEQEVLPVLLDVPLSQARVIRLVQLEDALRGCAGNIAVFYDADCLVQGDAGSARLDFRRIPVRHRTGVFHPKNILLLVEDREADDTGHSAQALIVGAMSANLTRSGWWENVEVGHLEEISEGAATRMKEDLLELLKRLRNQTPTAAPHEPLESIRKFLLQTDQRVNRVTDGSLHTHFYSGAEWFPDFLERCAGESLTGTYLEIISPYLGDAPTSEPLEELIRRFQPKEVRLFLPRDRDGVVACSPELYSAVKQLPSVSWGKMPPAIVRRGNSKDAPSRFVHAKIYRFFTQKPISEFLFVGSVNLTAPAHAKKGNWESGMLVEINCLRTPDFWLETDTARPVAFKPKDEKDAAKSGGTPLILRYHWDRGTAECYWDQDNASPALRLEARDVLLGNIGPLPAHDWFQMDLAFASLLVILLKETSFVKVTGYGEEPGLLLVQEEAMAHKPSLLLNLSAADILRYWSLLTSDQRAAFLEAKTLEKGLAKEDADLIARVKIEYTQETFFDRFAGVFHAFSCLENDVREKLTATRENEADYRIFGKKYDSLGTLLDRVFADTAHTDDVERYILLLCARQMLRELGRDYPDYWHLRRSDVQSLESSLQRVQEIRDRLSLTENAKDMPAFLDWFDGWFLKRGRPQEANP